MAAAGAGLLALGLAACGDASDDEGGASAAETTCRAGAVEYGEVDPEASASPVDGDALVVYSGRNEQLVAPILEEFTAETGIELAVRYGSTSSITAQILAEGAESPADVVLLQDAGALGALGDSDCLADLPAELTGQTFEAYADEDGRWVPVTGRARVVAYNPDLIAEAELPRDTADLVDPRFAGQLGIAPGNASFQAFVTALRQLEGEEAAEEFLRALVDNDAQTFDGNGDILTAVDSGQLPMGLINHYYWFELAAEVGVENVQVQLAYLQDGAAGSLVNVSGSGVISSTDRAEDATALVAFLLSDRAQEYFAQETYEYPMTDSVSAEAQLPPLDALQAPAIDLDDLASLSQTLELLDRVGLT
ncbi:extracellular solute-binding protein [Trujillonella humicola]|uniref:extracellular solute-binding protein n=1 Tax=Trujillonella humicola TaxID=3383699 RepID=UPI0039064202